MYRYSLWWCLSSVDTCLDCTWVQDTYELLIILGIPIHSLYVRITLSPCGSHRSSWGPTGPLADWTGPCEDHMTLLTINCSLWGSHDPLEDHTCPLEDLHLFLLPRNFSLQTPGVCSCMFCHVLGLEWPDGIPAMVVVTACMAAGVIVHSREEECRECTKRKSVQTPNQIQHHFTTWLGDCVSHMQWCCLLSVIWVWVNVSAQDDQFDVQAPGSLSDSN